MHPGITTRIVDYGVPGEFFDAKWKPADEAEVVFIGSLVESKGVLDLLEAFKERKIGKYRLHLIGDGKLMGVLRDQAESNIVFHGRLPRQRVVEVLARSWLLVAPTYADTGPSVVKEARVVGLPVVTTTAAGASEYVGGAGVVVEPGDVDALREAISKICQSRDNVIRLGAEGWKEIRRMLHPGYSANRFGKIYREMLGEG
jgi:glycosyltransferase involved in cell wall biosynthesis